MAVSCAAHAGKIRANDQRIIDSIYFSNILYLHVVEKISPVSKKPRYLSTTSMTAQTWSTVLRPCYTLHTS